MRVDNTGSTRDLSPDSTTSLLESAYDELRSTAVRLLAVDAAGQTLQPTALVHEAYLRLGDNQIWENRRHFYGTISLAMRRILIERARRLACQKRFLQTNHSRLVNSESPLHETPDHILEINELMADLKKSHPQAAEVVQLRVFAGLTIEQIASALEVSSRTIDRHWRTGRDWLTHRLARD